MFPFSQYLIKGDTTGRFIFFKLFYMISKPQTYFWQKGTLMNKVNTKSILHKNIFLKIEGDTSFS